jgi:hypothetical protein
MKSIHERLLEKGIIHIRDDDTPADGKHSLFLNNECLGRFDALEANNLLVSMQLIEDKNEIHGEYK